MGKVTGRQAVAIGRYRSRGSEGGRWFSGAEVRGIATSGAKEEQPDRASRRGPPARRQTGYGSTASAPETGTGSNEQR
ncbi:hypothetical protein [Adhaeribacter arboris]|uniref:hypothetical protein n=1 Tax=Adhaeribacter arboris TaxID=2072846 RepID=UPI0011B23E8B|nr:hypothetical protein [Adhaeribacter arboris]